MSMMVKIAFYKGKGNWINKIIRWWTRSNYSHAELVLPNKMTWIGISPFLSSKVESRHNITFKIKIAFFHVFYVFFKCWVILVHCGVQLH